MTQFKMFLLILAGIAIYVAAMYGILLGPQWLSFSILGVLFLILVWLIAGAAVKHLSK